MNFVICIPTYKRYKKLGEKTLTTLAIGKIPRKYIYIFVADKDEYKEYKKIYPSYKIIVGRLGLKNQRNFISEYFDNGQNILQMDDDIKGLYTKNKDGKPERIQDLKYLINKSFQYIRKNKSYLFGFYPVDNTYFLFDKTHFDLKLIVGSCFGIINRKGDYYKLTIDEKEDYERTLKHYLKDKCVTRFSNIGIMTDYFKNSGGMGKLEDRIEASKVSCEYMIK